MTGDPPKRRFRVRRKRRGAAGELADPVAGDVVQFGCCLVEAVTSIAVLLGLVLVPALLLLH